ncbi:hypothetical protein [Streptacidiphilus albus]|uniref:hypothetical protein n=1 Tax=Streptacidiphilus albus TaxID=105425 RepID=UPI00054B4DB8|nr:hypothetical protein [Streptacidiphilus albus]
MSWDLLVLPVPAEFVSIDDFPDDFTTEPIGSCEEVKATLRGRIPGIEFAEPTWGRLTGPTWSMELNLGSEASVDSIMLYVHGTGDAVLQAVIDIADAVSCRVIDTSRGDFLAKDDPSSWQAFQTYRDHVIRGD